MLPDDLSGSGIQVIVTLIGNILSFNFGLMFGCSASQADLYETSSTPLNRPITREIGRWIFSSFFLGTSFGALFAGPAAIMAGPKPMLLIAGIFQLFRWGTEHFAYDIQHIFFSRSFAGISGGITYVVLPIFIRDISQENTYAALLASIDLSRTFGIIIGYCIAEFTPYELIAIFGFVVSMLFQLFFPFVEESPYYYTYQNEGAKLDKALRFYRGIPDFRARLNEEYIQELAEFYLKMRENRPAIYGLPPSYIIRACVYFTALLLGAQVNGSFLILTFIPRILGESEDVILDDDQNFLIMALAQFLGSCTTIYTFRKVARRKLLAITSFTSGIILGTLAMYLAFTKDDEVIQWMPISMLSIHLLSAHMGLYPLAILFPSELFPCKLRLVLSSVFWSLTWFALFLFSFYRDLQPKTDDMMAITLFISAAFCFSLTVFGLFVLPETIDKTMEELQIEMGYVTRAVASAKSYVDAEQIATEQLYL